jgi:RNA exonuclease 4
VRKKKKKQKKVKRTDAAAPSGGGAAPPGAPGGSNWALLATKIGAGKNSKARRRAEARAAAERAAADASVPSPASASTPPARREDDKPKPASSTKRPMPTGRNTALTEVIALDCEMVGVGEDGRRSALARVSVVNEDGNVVLDTFVAPTERVTDYRTRVSGVRPVDLRDAPPFKEVQRKMADILRRRVLVGHALKNDLKCLLLDHPRRHTRDTALYRPLTRPLRANERAQNTGIARGRGSRSLRELCAQHLGLEIQAGEHSSVDDARAALLLYQKNAVAWERAIRAEGGGRVDFTKKTNEGTANYKGGAGDDEGKDGEGRRGDDEGEGGGGRRRAAGWAEEGREAAGGRGKKRRADPFAPGAERVDLFRR